MILTAKKLVRRVGRTLDLTKEEIDYILSIDKEHIFDIDLGDGKKHSAYRVQHNNVLGPYKGGVRFHPEVDLNEVRALSILMSLKTAAIGLPLGGGKGGIAVDPRTLTEEELEKLSRAYVKHLHPHIGPDHDIPAPDVNTNSKIIDWMVEEYELTTGDKTKASFTGKSIGKGGSLGRDPATGRGGSMALAEYLKLVGTNPSKLTVAVQGIGNVGFFFAKNAEKDLSVRIVGVGDSKQALVVKDFKKNNVGLSLEGFVETRRGMIGEIYDKKRCKFVPREEILELDVDVLVCAALGDSITKTNVHKIKAPIILELANGPVDDYALKELNQKGKVIIPDIIANSGGVIVSYLEWLQNKTNEIWPAEKVDEELRGYMGKAIRSVYKYSQENKVTMKEAALSLAIRRILKERHKKA